MCQQFIIRDSLEEFIEHHVVDMRRASSIKFNDNFRVRIVAIEGSELTAGISEQDQEMFGFATGNFL